MQTPSVKTTPPVPWGGALFSLGFRPFYLLAAALAIGGVAVWTIELLAAAGHPGPLPGIAWHAHEMVFGFGIAVITGFLFTAGRNWTGQPTPQGRLLAALCILWVAGRFFLLTGPAWAAALIDVSFLPAVAVCLWIPLHRARNRNRFFVGLLLALAALNGLFHAAAAGIVEIPPLQPVRAGLYLIAVIVTIMGGRVIPSFTANALRSARIRRRPWVDRAAIAATVVAFSFVLFSVPGFLAAAACLAAAVLQALRLLDWDPWCTRRTPILWILHLSYAWIPLALLLLGLAAAGAGVPVPLADHAVAVGAVGGMIIGMITRTARGHSGLPLAAGRLEIAAYALVHLAAAVRVFGPLAYPDVTAAWMTAAGSLWCTGFLAYLIRFVPVLTALRPEA